MKPQEILVVLLFLVSLLVLIRLVLGRNVQAGIVCYWLILTCKNYLDWRHRDG